MTEVFPKEEAYGLTSQIRRSSVSIPSNIAERSARESDSEYLRFLYISKGNMAELKTQLLIAQNIGYINEAEYEEIEKDTNEIGKMLNGLIN